MARSLQAYKPQNILVYRMFTNIQAREDLKILPAILSATHVFKPSTASNNDSYNERKATDLTDHRLSRKIAESLGKGTPKWFIKAKSNIVCLGPQNRGPKQ